MTAFVRQLFVKEWRSNLQSRHDTETIVVEPNSDYLINAATLRTVFNISESVLEGTNDTHQEMQPSNARKNTQYVGGNAN